MVQPLERCERHYFLQATGWFLFMAGVNAWAQALSLAKLSE